MRFYSRRNSKSNRKKFTRKNKNIQRGGIKKLFIDIRQILITEPIRSMLQNKGATSDIISQFKMSKTSEQGFNLSRMDKMMEQELEFNKLLLREPIEVLSVKRDGKQMGLMISGVKKPLYEIINGRHRFTRAILEGKTHILVKIID